MAAKRLLQEKKWDDTEWQVNFLAICKEKLSSYGVGSQNSFSDKRIMPWSFVGEIATDEGLFFCKSVSDASHFEPQLTRVLNQISDDIVNVVDYSVDGGWLITKGGNSVEELTQTDLVGVIKKYAQTQILSIEHKDRIIATGLPQYSPCSVESRMTEVIKRFENLPSNHPSHISKQEEDVLCKAIPLFVEVEAIVDSIPIEYAIDHGDLLVKNLLVDEQTATYRWFDFGDSSWVHPFISLEMILDKRSFPYLNVEKDLIIDAYLGEWEKFYNYKYNKNKLRMSFENAIWLAAIRRAEIRLSIMEMTSAEQLEDMASYSKDELLYVSRLLVNKGCFL